LIRGETPARLLATATAEFLRFGFDGTDANRIARRTGVAPAAFYRAFKDRVDAFLAVYADWAEAERRAFARLLGRPGPIDEIVAALVARTRRDANFRRSLRRLAQEDVRVRRALAAARLAAVADLASWLGPGRIDRASLAVDLIQVEHLATALAEGELAAMSVSEHAARGRLALLLMRWRIRPAGVVSEEAALGARA